MIISIYKQRLITQMLVNSISLCIIWKLQILKFIPASQKIVSIIHITVQSTVFCISVNAKISYSRDKLKNPIKRKTVKGKHQDNM